MAIITIQCRLQAQAETLRYLWRLMTEQNSLLVNEILEHLNSSPELNQWLSQGYISAETIKKIVKQLKQQPKYDGMPCRFSDSAETLVKDIYKSWFAIQRNKRNRMWGKKRWLAMIKSEQELLEQTGLSLPQLQAEAQKILIKEQENFDKLKQNKDSEAKIPQDLFTYLFQVYDKVTKNYEQEKKPHLKTKKLIKQSAVVYLLKNNCEISSEPEEPEQYQQYRRKKEIQLQRLEKQLKARLPKGRNLTKEEYLEVLAQAECLITESKEMELLQARLLRGVGSIPFPVSYYTNTDICWSKNERGRICASFNGMAKDGHQFEIFCHNRQLHWFQRFYEDYQLYKQHKKQMPAGLITLRSASLIWKQEENGESEQPWLTNNLYLHCSLETELWTEEGTEQIRQLKIAKTKEKIDKWLQQKSLNKNQQQKLKANQTSLSLLQSFQDFARPSQLILQPNYSLIMGVSIGLREPVTVSIVNVNSSQILACFHTRQLLSKPIQQQPPSGKNPKKLTQYELFLRRRQKQPENDVKRQQAQTNFANNRFGESELGQYVDRLIAKAVVEIALKYRVSSIVLPDLKNIREILDSEIQAKAEAKAPGCKKAQKKYARNYRQSIHRWSYARLCDAIKSKASQKGLAIESCFQLPSGTPEIQAKDLALTAYHQRQEEIS